MNGRALLNCAAILGLALLLVSCGENRGDEDQTAPDAPVMRLTACSFEGPVWPESGVDAEPGSTGIRVEWQLWPRPEDLAGFVVFRGHQENADTVGLEALYRMSRLPSRISAFVPTSTIRVVAVCR